MIAVSGAMMCVYSSVPAVEDDFAEVGVESQTRHLHTHRRNVLLLKLTCITTTQHMDVDNIVRMSVL